MWLGLYPTWQGLLAQAAALAFVVGSYLAAEAMRKRRRARLLLGTSMANGRGSVEVGEGAAHGLDSGRDVLVGVSGRDEPASERVAVPVDAALLERVAEPGEASGVLERRRPRSR